MFYGILTKAGGGGPFYRLESPPQAPGPALRVSATAVLLGFESQPCRLFASQYANGSGHILWFVEEGMLHEDDLPAVAVFEYTHDFQIWLSTLDRLSSE